jgi:hypothetical protein
MPPATHCIMLSCSDALPVPAGTGGVADGSGGIGTGTGCPCANRTGFQNIGLISDCPNTYPFFFPIVARK